MKSNTVLKFQETTDHFPVKSELLQQFSITKLMCFSLKGRNSKQINAHIPNITLGLPNTAKDSLPWILIVWEIRLQQGLHFSPKGLGIQT